MVKDVLEGPTEETPGWHAGELETSQCLCHNPGIVRMDRAVMDQAHAPKYMTKQWKKKDGMPDLEFQGYSYFNMPFEHDEFTDTGMMGNPFRARRLQGRDRLHPFRQPPDRRRARVRAGEGHGQEPRLERRQDDGLVCVVNVPRRTERADAPG